MPSREPSQKRPRGLRQRGRHEVGREAHDAGRAVHVGAVLGEDVQRLRRAEPDAGPLEHAEHGVLVAVELRVVVEADGEVRAERQQRLPPAEVELRAHESPYSSPALALKRSTELIGMSSTSAMWNLASIVPGWSA